MVTLMDVLKDTAQAMVSALSSHTKQLYFFSTDFINCEKETVGITIIPQFGKPKVSVVFSINFSEEKPKSKLRLETTKPVKFRAGCSRKSLAKALHVIRKDLMRNLASVEIPEDFFDEPWHPRVTTLHIVKEQEILS